MIRAHRVMLAMVVAPAATPLFMLGAELLYRGKLSSAAPTTGWIVMAASYALSYTIGAPIYLLARRRRWRTVVEYMQGGFLIGMVAVTLCTVILLAADAFHGLSPGYSLSTDVWGLLIAVLLGPLTVPIGLVFWLIARPDRSING